LVRVDAGRDEQMQYMQKEVQGSFVVRVQGSNFVL